MPISQETQIQNVLNAFYKNASVGVSAVNSIINKTETPRLKSELSRQLNYYEHQEQRIKNQFNKIYQSPKEQGTLVKTMSSLSIDMHTFVHKNPSNIAKLMIEGTNMGIIELVTALNHNQDVPKPIKDEGKRILDHEQNYIEKLKPYL